MEGRPDEMPPQDPARLRISDEDRHQVAEVLRKAAGEGRIDLDELEERLEATYAAKTYGDLVPITADLPVRTTVPPHVSPPSLRPVGGVQVPAASYTTSLAFMSDCTRRGAWRVPGQHTALAMMGSVTLDLREALFDSHEVTITAVAVMAGVDVVVNAGTQVIVEGVGIMGEFGQRGDRVPAALTADSPVVRLRGLALMGGVAVQRRPMPGEPRGRLGRGPR